MRVVSLMALGASACVWIACIASYEMTDTVPSTRSCPDPEAAASLIDWYIPVKRGDNDKLERWCRTLGPPVFDSVPRRDFGTLEAGDSLAIGIFNPDGGSADLLTFIQEQMGLDCTVPSSQRRSGPSHFVLLLQEALRRSNEIPEVRKQFETLRAVDPERPDSVLDVLQVAERCGLSVFYVPSVRNGWATRDGKREDKGNAILSTMALSDPIAIELPLEGARRMAVAATVRSASGDSVRFVSVHLETTPGLWRLIRTGNASRLRQVLGLTDALARLQTERGAPGVDPGAGQYDISTVLGGDLNIWSTSETSFRHLREYFPDSPGPLEDGTRGPFPTDHILFRRSTVGSAGAGIVASTYRRIDDAYGSDHRPSMAWIRFGR